MLYLVFGWNDFKSSSSDLVKSIWNVVGVKSVFPGTAPADCISLVSLGCLGMLGSNFIKTRLFSLPSFIKSRRISLVGAVPFQKCQFVISKWQLVKGQNSIFSFRTSFPHSRGTPAHAEVCKGCMAILSRLVVML